MGYSEDLAIEKRPKMRCNWASKSPSYFLPVPNLSKETLRVHSAFVLWSHWRLTSTRSFFPSTGRSAVTRSCEVLGTFQPDGLSECAVCRDVPYLHPHPTLPTQICVNSQRVLSEGLGC